MTATLPEARDVGLAPQATDRRLREEGAGCRTSTSPTHGLFQAGQPDVLGGATRVTGLSLLNLSSCGLSADLVTLSGCGTGLSAVVGGDELVGLVRGLLYAGARALLVTLWDVNDRSTAFFMRSFYAHLRGCDKRRALAAAVRELRAEYPHPYFWAPFVLIGDPAGPDGISPAPLLTPLFQGPVSLNAPLSGTSEAPMIHYDMADWVDYLRGLERRAQPRRHGGQHLRDGCRSCRASLARLAAVARHRGCRRSPRAPAHALRYARAVFTQFGPERVCELAPAAGPLGARQLSRSASRGRARERARKPGRRLYEPGRRVRGRAPGTASRAVGRWPSSAQLLCSEGAGVTPRLLARGQ